LELEKIGLPTVLCLPASSPKGGVDGARAGRVPEPARRSREIKPSADNG
jgi:hypothetical protein